MFERAFGMLEDEKLRTLFSLNGYCNIGLAVSPSDFANREGRRFTAQENRNRRGKVSVAIARITVEAGCRPLSEPGHPYFRRR